MGLFRKKRKKRSDNVVMVFLVIGIFLVVFNQYNLMQVGYKIDSVLYTNQLREGQNGNVFAVSLTGDTVSDAISAVISTGPTPYGNGELSYDDVEGGLQLLKAADIGIPTESLTKEQLQRYITVGLRISCEYCCGAKAVIFPNGAAACGCAHSYALRGLAKYLITEYGDQYTDEEILFEMTKWKNLFFPKFTVTKAMALIDNGIDITPDALNDRDLLNKISLGDTSSIGNLDTMVGGC